MALHGTIETGLVRALALSSPSQLGFPRVTRQSEVDDGARLTATNPTDTPDDKRCFAFSCGGFLAPVVGKELDRGLWIFIISVSMYTVQVSQSPVDFLHLRWIRLHFLYSFADSPSKSNSVVQSRNVSRSAYIISKYPQSNMNASTHPQSMLLIDSLIILAREHITEVSNRRIMHNGNLIPPIRLCSTGRTPRVRIITPRLDDVSHELRASATFARDRNECLSHQLPSGNHSKKRGESYLSVVIITLLPAWMIKMQQIQHRHRLIMFPRQLIHELQ